MFFHSEIDNGNFAGKRRLVRLLQTGEIVLAGNKKLKIYGSLLCKSGKRMKKETRVFFSSEKEAVDAGFRPCGHCMKAVYKKWKHGII